mmetsp:Transcript_89401/g.233153  ORF Transcript_89401/g.233153 Transcript_89401/m.233153 type:complete len:252 (+) Transcript_89401:20-775(+)
MFVARAAPSPSSGPVWQSRIRGVAAMALCSSTCCQAADATESVLASSLPIVADPFREELESRGLKVLERAASVAFQEEKRPLPKDRGKFTSRVQDPKADVEANAFRRPAEKTTTWVYKPINGKMIEVRLFKTCSNGREDRAGHRVIPDEAFDVEEEHLATQDGEKIVYLKLADGRGWLFDHKPGVGVMCVRQDGSDRLPPLSGVSPPAGGVPDLAKAAEVDLAGAQGGAGDAPQDARGAGTKVCTGSPDRV